MWFENSETPLADYPWRSLARLGQLVTTALLKATLRTSINSFLTVSERSMAITTILDKVDNEVSSDTVDDETPPIERTIDTLQLTRGVLLARAWEAIRPLRGGSVNW